MESPTTNPLALLSDIAHTQLGVHEIGDSNSGPQVIEYQRATSEPGTGWPWCAAFVCWCVRELAKMRPGLLSCDVHHCLPTQASVEELIDWAKQTGQWVFTPDEHVALPQAGDIICMEFTTGRHVGIVSGPPISAALFPTIEGNTSGPIHANSDERNGCEVAAKTRTSLSVTHFIRLTLEAQPVNSNPPARPA